MSKFSRILVCVTATLCSLCLSCADLYAQEDTEFWFAMPRMLSWHNYVKGASYQLIIYNHNTVAAHVSISQPANTESGRISKSALVKANGSEVITLASSSQVFPNPDSVSVPFDMVSKRGLYVKSDVSVECYFQVTKGNGEAYTMKGQNALGTEFVVAMQNKFDNGRGTEKEVEFNGKKFKVNMYDDSYSSIAVVASEDNTSVTIAPTKKVGKSCNTSPIKITLNRGETYATHACSEKGSDHPVGTLITSSKPIAVTYNDDCAMSGKSSDAIGEQLTPTFLAGDQYVAVSNKTSNDYLFLIGLSNGTTVTDDSNKKYNLDKGTVEQISLAEKSAIYLKGTSPFEVFQVTAYKSKNGNEMGGTVLPQISCTGSTNASYHRVNEGVILNLVTHKDNISAISVNGKAVSSSDFTKIGSADFYYFSADVKDKFGISDQDIRVVSSKGVFQMGVLDYKDKETATFGFFSNYASSAVVTINDENTNRYTICKGEPLHVLVSPVDKTINLEDAEVEWHDLLDGGKVRPDLKSDVYDVAKVDFDTAAFQVVWKNACGISSFVNVMISVKEPLYVEETQTACNSYKWALDGKTYTESGDYTYETTTSFGCKETHVLHLTVNKPKIVHDIVTASKNYIWPRNGKLITGSSSTYSEDTDKDGCPDVQYNLTLTYIGVQTSDSYSWRGHSYNESGTYSEPTVTLSDGTEENYSLILELIKPTQRPFSTGNCGITVTFAQGNLQYQPSTDTWRFADNQWDIIGASNENISDTYSGWIDLFGWATGNNPTNTSGDNTTYGPGVSELTETDYDWGSNTISNGGGAEWHSLSYKEWKYILTDRKDAANKYGCATVNSVKGVVLLPDDWELPAGKSFKASYSDYGSNVYSADDWAVMQSAGAVFLPATGTRYPSGTINKVNNTGYYWTATAIGKDKAWDFYFDNTKVEYFQGTRSYGDGVRLVKYVNAVPHVGLGEFSKETCDGSYTWNGITYTESGDYQQTLTNNGCDSIVTLHLKVGQKYVVDTFAVECDEFTWHEKKYTKSTTAVYATKTVLGCDSVVTLHLTINKSETQELTVSECDSYYWPEADKEYTESGDYTIETTTKDGCKRTVTLHLTINESQDVYLDPVEACDSYYWDKTGHTYTESGIYYTEAKTAAGCDLTTYLDLTIHHSADDNIYVTECDEYEWEGTKYTESGKFTKKFVSKSGCDSTVTLNLTINKSENVTLPPVAACDSYYWNKTDKTYTESGNYEYFTTTADGCERKETLPLTINKSESVTLSPVTACDSYYWDKTGKTYTESGNYDYISTTADGCERKETLPLTINKSESVTLSPVTACDNYYWEKTGMTYTESGNYDFISTTAEGCEYKETLPLTINKSEIVTLSPVTACDSYYWDKTGQTYTESGNYDFISTTAEGCEYKETLPLTINKSESVVLPQVESCDSYYWDRTGMTYTESGNYEYFSTTAEGCEYKETLPLIINKSVKAVVDTVVCDSFIWHGTTFYYDEHNPLNNLRPSLYSGHTQAGCDSLITFNFTICKSYHVDSTAVECDEFVWYGKKYTDSGDYQYTKQTVNGCDSTVILHLTINKKQETTITATICPEYSYAVEDVYGGNETVYFNTEGLHTAHISTKAGCDSIVNVKLSFYTNEPIHIYDTVCAGETYYRNSQSYTEPGDYLTKQSNEFGCQYTEYLHLAHYPVYNNHVYDTICDNQIYEWESSKYNTTTIDTKYLKSIHGCDSVVTLHLQVWPTFKEQDKRVLCEGESFSWGDYDIPSVKPSDSRTYSYTFHTVHGCDSVVDLDLLVNHVYDVSFDAQVCDNEVYHWEGSNYAFDGKRQIKDTKVLKSINDCDSVVTMNLRFNETKESSFDITICDNETYEWNGTHYNTTGNHVQQLFTSLGCDSVVTMHLTVNPTYHVEWADTILENNTLTWQGTTYSEAGDYTKTLTTHEDCDSVVTLHLTKNLIQISDIGYAEFCVERDSAGMFSLQVPVGFITNARMRFSDEAHNQGIRDTVININGNNQQINVIVPMAAKAGIYDLTVEYYFRKELVYTQNVRFHVLFPSQVLLQKWNDFIGVQTERYNGGYTFVAFEWFKNGERLIGESGSYIYQQLELGAAYSALLTDTAGIQLFTCPLYAVDKDDIGLYPTVVKPDNRIRLHVTRPAELKIFDATGKLVGTQTFDSGETDFEAPQQNGMYIMRVLLDDNETEKTYKVVVQ